MPPKVSIIVPVYKTPKDLLARCIQSLLNQTLTEIEPILVDDGSPDDCCSVLDEYAKQDSRIKVIHKKNGGLCSARNAGFLSSTGKWVTFVDSDDYLEEDACEELFLAGEKNQVELVMCGIFRNYSNSQKEYRFYLEDDKVYQGEECKWLKEQLLHYNGNIACVYAKLFLRDFLLKNSLLHDEVLRQGEEGLEFNYRVFRKLNKAVFIRKPLYHYVYNSSSITAVSTEANNQYVIHCYEKIKEYVLEDSSEKNLLPWFYNRMMYVVVTTIISGYFNPASKEKYQMRKKMAKQYLAIDIVKETLESRDFFNLSKARRIVLFAIRHHYFLLLSLMGKMRRFQKQHR